MRFFIETLSAFNLPARSDGVARTASTPYFSMFSLIYQWAAAELASQQPQVPGTVLEWSFPEMPITVNLDCTATIASKGMVKGSSRVNTATDFALVLNGGDELWTLQTQNSAAVSMLLAGFKRISTVAAPATR
jgi:hypothetical protein